MTTNWIRFPSKRRVTGEALSLLGQELARLRTRPTENSPRGLTQKEVAGLLGVSSSYVSQVEGGRTILSLRLLRQLAGIYDVMPAVLFRYFGLQEFDWLALSDQEIGQPPQGDPFADLDDELRTELISYLTYLRLRRSVTNA